MSEDDEQMTCLDDAVDMYHKGKTNYQDVNDSDVIFEYVEWEDFVSPLAADELLRLVLNRHNIRELDAKYNYALHLEDKIINELRWKEPFDILSFANEYEYMIVYPSTGEVEFDSEDHSYQNNCDCYDTDQFIKRGQTVNVPDRNIFCGYQFHEPPIRELDRSEYLEWLSWMEDDESYINQSS